MRPRRTNHQREVMGLILRETNEGRVVYQSEIQSMLSYGAEVTYGAIRETINCLIDQGMVVRLKDKNDSRKSIIAPTDRGYDWFRPKR